MGLRKVFLSFSEGNLPAGRQEERARMGRLFITNYLTSFFVFRRLCRSTYSAVTSLEFTRRWLVWVASFDRSFKKGSKLPEGKRISILNHNRFCASRVGAPLLGLGAGEGKCTKPIMVQYIWLVISKLSATMFISAIKPAYCSASLIILEVLLSTFFTCIL